MILDATVLVDLQRELRKGEPGPATPVVSRNERHFARVPGLAVRSN